jgi:hypothetical protein
MQSVDILRGKPSSRRGDVLLVISQNIDSLENGIEDRVVKHIVAPASQVAANADERVEAAGRNGHIVGRFEVLPNNVHASARFEALAQWDTVVAVRGVGCWAVDWQVHPPWRAN